MPFGQKSETVEVVIRARNAAGGALKDLNKGFTAMRGSVGKLGKSLLNLKTAIAGVAAGFIAHDLVGASNKQAVAVAGMGAAMKSMGRYTPELSAKLQGLAESLQQTTNFGDEATIAGEKFLVTYKQIPDKLLPRTTKAMLDLAALMGGDTVQAANMMGKAAMGMTGELRRAGITVDTTTYKEQGFLGVLKEIEAQVRGQAEAQRKATGPWIAIGNAIGDVKEKLGDLIKIAFEPFGNNILRVLTLVNKGLKAFLKSADLKAWAKNAQDYIQSFIEGTLLKAAGFYDAIKPIIHNISVVLSSVWKTFQELPDWVRDVGIVVAFLGGKKIAIAVAGLAHLYQAFKNMATGLKLVAEGQLKFTDFAHMNFEKLATYIEKTNKQIGDGAQIVRVRIKKTATNIKDFLAQFGAADSATAKVKLLIQYLRQLQAAPQTPAKTSVPAEEPPPKKIVDPALLAARSKAAMDRLQARTETALLRLQNLYKQGQVTLADYFNQRKDLIVKEYAAEIALAEKAAKQETDPKKQVAANQKVLDLREKLNQALLKLDQDRFDAEKQLKEKSVQVDNILADTRLRAANKLNGDLEASFNAELAQMDKAHQEEIKKLTDLHATQAQLNEEYRNQELEKDRLQEDQHRRLMEARLKMVSDVAGGMADIFSGLYEISGKKQKEFFYLSKAAAMAQATINNAVAATKAYSQGGIFGPIMAAVIVAKGAIEMAKISAQTMAAGGRIRGSSPSDKADNVPIMATANEWIMPVRSARYYGEKVMEGLRSMTIPRNLFAGLSLPSFRPPALSYAFASGGPVPNTPAGGTGRGDKGGDINIVNVIDPSTLDQYLASANGQNAILNILSARADTVKRVLR